MTKSNYRICAALSGALALICGAANAQQASMADSIPPYFLERIGLGGGEQPLYQERFLVIAMADFRKLSGDDQVLDRSDIDAMEAVQSAYYRSMIVQTIMSNDVNGDGSVTEGEIRQSFVVSSERQIPGNLDGLVKGYLVADANGDKTITMDEATAFAKDHPADARPGSGNPVAKMETLLTFAPAGSDRLTAADLDAAARAAFATADQNANGQLDDAELAPVRQEARKLFRSRPMMPLAGCKFPKISPDARLVFVAGYESETISNLTVAGQDEATGTQEIAVSPGKGPVYIVASSFNPMIWRLTGAVDRVETFVSTSKRNADGKIASGVTGIAAAKANFLQAECVPLSETFADGGVAKVGDVMIQLVGRKADEVFFRYAPDFPSGEIGGSAVKSVDLPGTQAKPLAAYPKSASRETYEAMLRYSPGGTFTINPKWVVSNAQVEPYAILPKGAGLLQLEIDGAIVRAVSRGRPSYRIVKNIRRFPPGLNGALSVAFSLAPGVALPAGNAGHSTVLSEETGRMLEVGRNRPQTPFVDPFANIPVFGMR